MFKTSSKPVPEISPVVCNNQKIFVKYLNLVLQHVKSKKSDAHLVVTHEQISP